MTKYAKLGPSSTSPVIAKFIRKAAPGYRKKSVRLYITDEVTLSGRYWSGGSKDEYRLYSQYGVFHQNFGAVNPGNHNPMYDEFSISDGFVVLRTGTFCGKPATISLFIHPSCTELVDEVNRIEDD